VLFPLDGWQVTTGGVQSEAVVPGDPGEDRGAGLGPGPVVSPVDQFDLEGGDKALGDGVDAPVDRQVDLCGLEWLGGRGCGDWEEPVDLAGDVALEFPESSSGGEPPFCAVPGGVVDRVVVPAGPHDPQPGPSEDADGVGMVLAAAAGVGVEVGRPG